jgi:hypothetical protein
VRLEGLVKVIQVVRFEVFMAVTMKNGSMRRLLVTASVRCS